MSVKCNCSDFTLSWPQIIGAQVLANLHGICYDGEVIRYCPWCGKEVVVENINNKEQLNLFNEEKKNDESL